jgi:phosphoribosylglycinamide formyltransferase 2
MPMDKERLEEAQEMAKKVTDALGGAGIWGVEFFITKDTTYFSELSPRPHDTGMVTLAGTQNFSEFELHARAVLGFPIPEIKLMKNGASAVILANQTSLEQPKFSGLEEAMNAIDTDLRIFGKPNSRPNRRMAVTLTYGKEDVDSLVQRAKELAAKITVN